MRRVHALARLRAADRRRLLERFWDRVLEGIPLDASVAERFRLGGVPDLPDEPTEVQLDAWLELAELATDDDFVRRTREAGAWFWQRVVQPYDADAWQASSSALAERAAALSARGVAAADPEAEPLVDELAHRYADAFGQPDSPEFRAWLSRQLEATTNPQAPRYWQLVATVAGLPHDPAQQRLANAYTWLFEALQKHATS